MNMNIMYFKIYVNNFCRLRSTLAADIVQTIFTTKLQQNASHAPSTTGNNNKKT